MTELLVKKKKQNKEKKDWEVKKTDIFRNINILFHLGLVFVVIVLIFLAIHAYFGGFNDVHPHLGDRIFRGGFIVQQNPDFPPELDMQVLLKTSSLSAKNPITIEARMFPNENILMFKPDPWPYLPDKQFLIFPFGLLHPLDQTEDGYNKPAIIELEKSTEQREYSGTGEIFYEVGGEYGFYFVGPQAIESDRKGSSINFSLEEIQENILEKSHFIVESSNVTFSLQQTNYALTTLFLGLIGFILKFRIGIRDTIFLLNRVNRPKLTKNMGFFIIGFIVSIVIAITFLGIALSNNPSEDFEGFEGDTFFNKKLGFQISRPDSDWFFIRDFSYNKERFDSSLSEHTMAGGIIIQQKIDEKVSVLVFDGPHLEGEELLEFTSNDLISISEPGRKGKFNYHQDASLPGVVLSGYFEEPKMIVEGKFITKENFIFLIYGEVFSENEKNLKIIKEIMDSFKLI